jgi:hypothetical protein
MEASGLLHAPAALPAVKRPRYPLDRRLGGSRRRGEEKNSASIENWTRVVHPADVSLLTELANPPNKLLQALGAQSFLRSW